MRPFSRRQLLQAVGAISLFAPAETRVRSQQAGSAFLSGFFSFDREIQKFMAARNIPGGALAVVKDRRLVYTRGYGWADRENKIPVKPASLFRIASVAKPFTAVAVLKLVEEDNLSLDARVFDLLASGTDAPKPTVGKPDERWKQITVQHLLHHTGGWDRDKSFDPMFRARQIAKALGIASPPAPRDIIRYMLGQPLDFDPGTRYAYSNFGYCILGRVIEKIAGVSYEKFVQDKVLAPIGIKRMRIDGSLKDHYYGCGWLVRPVGKPGMANYWHTGSLLGTCTLLVRRWDGLSWAVLFNQRSDDDKLPDNEIDPALHRAADAVTEWPKFDLFPQYQ